MTLAHQMKKHDNDLVWADAVKDAWSFIKDENELIELISFFKVDRKTGDKKESVNRVIFRKHWSKFYTPKGTGRPLKKGQVLMVDVARWATKSKNFLISTYEDRIESRL